MVPRISYQIPTAEEYNDLRKSVEWPTFEDELVKHGLLNSLFSVVVHDESGSIVGMGRILGDNAIYLHVQDVIVRPDFQGQGIGKLIMKELLTYIKNVGVKNTNVGLMCSKGREEFYKAFGFDVRPSDKFGAGMIKILQ